MESAYACIRSLRFEIRMMFMYVERIFTRRETQKSIVYEIYNNV